jgi:hypothetical protein
MPFSLDGAPFLQTGHRPAYFAVTRKMPFAEYDGSFVAALVVPQFPAPTGGSNADVLQKDLRNFSWAPSQC